MNKEADFDYGRHEVSCRTINTMIKYVQMQGKDVKSLLV